MDNCAYQSSISTSVDVSIGIIDIVIAGQQRIKKCCVRTRNCNSWSGSKNTS